MSYTQVPPDSTGNKIETELMGSGLHRQVVVLGGNAAGDDVITQLKAVADSLLFVAAAMLEKLPRVTGSDQMACSIEGRPTVYLEGSLDAVNKVGGRWASGDNLNQSGVAYIYNQITVA